MITIAIRADGVYLPKYWADSLTNQNMLDRGYELIDIENIPSIDYIELEDFDNNNGTKSLNLQRHKSRLVTIADINEQIDYEQLVNQYILEKFSIESQIAIIRQKTLRRLSIKDFTNIAKAVKRAKDSARKLKENWLFSMIWKSPRSNQNFVDLQGKV